MNCDLLFVYGTLRRGFARHSVLQRVHARYVGRGTTQGELYDLGEFPGAQKSQSASTRIIGEIYQLPNPARALRVLDEIEGFRPRDPASSLFRRDTAAILLENDKQLTAWVYWLNREPWPTSRILSGDYGRGRNA